MKRLYLIILLAVFLNQLSSFSQILEENDHVFGLQMSGLGAQNSSSFYFNSSLSYDYILVDGTMPHSVGFQGGLNIGHIIEYYTLVPFSLYNSWGLKYSFAAGALFRNLGVGNPAPINLFENGFKDKYDGTSVSALMRGSLSYGFELEGYYISPVIFFEFFDKYHRAGLGFSVNVPSGNLNF